MIRIRKPLRLYEWGQGTNTTNQIWSSSGEGKIVAYKVKDGLTTLTVDLSSPIIKNNEKDNSLKLTQPGEGMTANAERWGEVATGTLKAIESGGKRIEVEIPYATKIDTRRIGDE